MVKNTSHIRGTGEAAIKMQGYTAFQVGAMQQHCPYNQYDDPEKRTYWLTGWFEAKREQRLNKELYKDIN